MIMTSTGGFTLKTRRTLKTLREVSLLKGIKCFPRIHASPPEKDEKAKQQPIILHLSQLSKTQAGEYHDDLNAIVFESSAFKFHRRSRCERGLCRLVLHLLFKHQNFPLSTGDPFSYLSGSSHLNLLKCPLKYACVF